MEDWFKDMVGEMILEEIDFLDKEIKFFEALEKKQSEREDD